METNSNATTTKDANKAIAPRVFWPAAAIILGAILAAFALSNTSVLVSDDAGIVEVGESVGGAEIDSYAVADGTDVVDGDGNKVDQIGGATVKADADGNIYAVNADDHIVAFGEVTDDDGNVLASDGEPVVIDDTSFAIDDEGVVTDADGNAFKTDEDDYTVTSDGDRVDIASLPTTYALTSVAAGILFLDGSGELIGTGTNDSLATYAMVSANDWISETLGWYYMAAVVFFIVLALSFGLSRFGKLRLGRTEDEKPEFSRISWFSMLFSAGMGIGLVFYGASEPLWHMQTPPYLPADQASTAAAAKDAMLATFMHWGIHAWAIYVVLGLAIAFAVHRRGRPVTIRWALEPLLGEKRVRGALGDLIDVTAVVATLFGVATSLGIGSAQINSGLLVLFGDSLPEWALAEAGGGTVLQIIVIGVVTSIAVWSVLTGVKKGIKWLSNINMILAAAILLFFFIAGPTLFIFREFFSAMGYYFQNILSATFNAGAFPVEEGADPAVFQTAWTVFYWGWWISWAPFVAVFIARISKGRTIREFVIGVLLVPTIVSFIWFSALGGTGIDQQLNQGKNLTFANEADGLFLVLDNMPWTTLMTGVATILVVTFFVTSSDSGSLVIDMLSSGGNIDPPKATRLFWALMEGAAAIALLLIGGLDALKYAAIILALPFSIVLIGAGIATWKGLSKDFDDTMIKRAGGPPKVEADKTPEPV